MWLKAGNFVFGIYQQIKGAYADDVSMKDIKYEELRKKARALVCLKISDTNFSIKAYAMLKNFNVSEQCLEKTPFKNGLKRAKCMTVEVMGAAQ